MTIQTHIAALVIPGFPQRCIRCCEPLSKFLATDYPPGVIVATIGVAATVRISKLFDVFPCQQFEETYEPEEQGAGNALGSGDGSSLGVNPFRSTAKKKDESTGTDVSCAAAAGE